MMIRTSLSFCTVLVWTVAVFTAWRGTVDCFQMSPATKVLLQLQKHPIHAGAFETRLYGMKRPILDTLASTLFKLEQSRVESSSQVDEQGRMGEPMEWSESNSWANRFSEAIASNSLGYQFKQFVADIVAGDYDEEAVRTKVEDFIAGNDDAANQQQYARVAMFSFTACPFCRRAKDYLDNRGIPYSSMELDELEGNEGNQIRAVLGKMTQRTSVPSIFVGGTYIGGCNDGPGLLPLAESGELDQLLSGSNQ
jgi:glutaredoxin 3